MTQHVHWLFLSLLLLLSRPAKSAAVCSMSGLPSTVGEICTAIGGGNGDGGPAINALADPRGVATAGSGAAFTLYIADGLNNRVRKVTAGTNSLLESSDPIALVAGTGSPGCVNALTTPTLCFGGDGGLATNAKLWFPTNVVVDTNGNVFVADTSNHRVRRIDAQGIITTVVGNGDPGSTGVPIGDGGPATQANINHPRGLAFDGSGNLYIAEFDGNRIRRVAPNGMITTVAGNGSWGYAGDGGPATQAKLANPMGVVVDTQGTLYLADFGNSRVRKVSAQGLISSVAGNGFQGFTGDGGPARAAQLKLPQQVMLDTQGNLLVLDTGNARVRRIEATTGIITTIAGNGTTGSAGDGGAATAASFFPLSGFTVDSTNTVYLAITVNTTQSSDNRVRVITPAGVISTLVGSGNGDGGPAINALINPRGLVAVERTGGTDLYIADGNNNRVRKVDGTTQLVSTVAGTGVAGFSGDGGAALQAQLSAPYDVVRDPVGILYIADTFNNRIRTVSSNGTITTWAGNGVYTYGGDGGDALNASLAYPYGVDVDPAGNLYIADFTNNRIRKVTPQRIITTVAGTGQWGSGGDGGVATQAKLASPTDVVVASDGSLYLADYGNNTIRRVRPDGIIERIAGTNFPGFSGDGGPALNAQLYNPFRLAFDAQNNLFIGDAINLRVRRIDASTHFITTVAGTGTQGTGGDGSPATQADLYRAHGLAVDSQGYLYISQSDSNRVRVVKLPQPPTTTYTLSGQTKYYSNTTAVPAVTIQLTGPSAPGNPITDGTGTYQTPALASGAWTLTPTKQGARGAAISPQDAVAIFEYKVGLRTLTPAQQLAADVSGDGTVSAFDAALILQYKVGIITQLPAAQTCGSDWLFVPTASLPPSQQIPPLLRTGTCQMGALTYPSLTSNQTGQDFTALLLGDVTGNWIP